MAGGTGNIRTLRAQSASNGNRTIGSILASSVAGGAGSVRRIYGWYRNQNQGDFYQSVFDIKYGQFKNRRREFLLGSLNAGN